jgi:hypothetical protein
MEDRDATAIWHATGTAQWGMGLSGMGVFHCLLPCHGRGDSASAGRILDPGISGHGIAVHHGLDFELVQDTARRSRIAKTGFTSGRSARRETAHRASSVEVARGLQVIAFGEVQPTVAAQSSRKHSRLNCTEDDTDVQLH